MTHGPLLQQPGLFRMRIPPCATCLPPVFVSYLQHSPAHIRVSKTLHALSILTRDYCLKRWPTGGTPHRLASAVSRRPHPTAPTHNQAGALDTDSDADASKPQAILDSQDRRAYGRAYGRAASKLAAEQAAEQAAEHVAQPLGFAIVGISTYRIAYHLLLVTTPYHLQCTFTYHHLLPPTGMGRAGKIHLACLQETGGEAVVCWLVDTNPAVLSPYAQGARVSTDVAEALRDDTVTCVIVCTPTPHHAPLIRMALAAGKHVFAEKPLCCGAQEAGK